MNIYNKFYFIEYVRQPIYIYNFNCKEWYLNTSKQKTLFLHRDFDLFAFVHNQDKQWFQFSNKCRFIGPYFIIKHKYKHNDYTKYYHNINNPIVIIKS